MSRSYHRPSHEMRPVKLTCNVNEYAAGSVQVEFGKTRVICTATVESKVPQWLMGSGKGWVTAEYAMLPTATHSRTKRERDKIGGRTQEIQRLIGRALRAVVDLKKMPDKSIIIDCDVIQADGGTRTASITGAYVALVMALRKLGMEAAVIGQVSALSVGIKSGEIFVDLDYGEDSSCEVDMNFVIMADGGFVEVQGTAEQKPFSRDQMNRMTDAAVTAAMQLHQIQNDALKA
jgi:ribonuclease PH